MKHWTEKHWEDSGACVDATDDGGNVSFDVGFDSQCITDLTPAQLRTLVNLATKALEDYETGTARAAIKAAGGQ